MLADCFGSPLIVADRVYVCNQDGNVLIFRLSRDRQLLQTIAIHEIIDGAPIAANKVLYVSTRQHLFAIEAAKE